MKHNTGNIDALRALAIVSVFIHHCSHSFNLHIPFFSKFGGQFGVQLFFIISGYLISHSVTRRPAKAYAVQRIFRIFPAYVALYILLGIGIGVLTPAAIQHGWQGILINLLSLQHVFPVALVAYDVFHVSWTLTVELFWYLLAPLTVMLLRSKKRATTTVAILISLSWAYASHQGNLDHLYPNQHALTGHSLEHFRTLFLSNAFPAVFCFFILGALVQHTQNVVTTVPKTVLLMAFGLLAVLLPYGLPPAFQPSFLYAVGLTALLVLALSTQNISNKLIKWLANISYSFYLIHFTVILYLANNYSTNSLLLMLAAFTISALLALISYQTIERPMIKLGRRYSSRVQT